MADAGSKKSEDKKLSAQALERLAAEKEASEDRVFALTHRVATLEVRERDLTELIIGHRERVAALQAERETFVRELDRSKSEVDAARQRESALYDELSASRERAAALEAERAGLIEKLDAEKRRADRLSARDIEREGRLAELERNHELAKAEVERVEQRSAALSERQRELDDQLETHRDLAPQIAALEAERDVLREGLDASRSEIAGLRDREREVQSRMVILHEQVARLEAEEEMLNRALAEERTARSALEQQESGLRPQLESARERVRSLESQHAELLETAHQRERELSGARERIAGLETRRDELASEFEGERRALAELRERDQELQRELGELRDREAELETTLQGVRDQVGSLETQRNSLITERDRLNAERDRLRTRLEQLESSRTYRVMRATWRIRARLRHPFRPAAPRPALSKPKKAAAKPERPAIAAPAPKPVPAPEGRKLKPIPTPKMRPAPARAAEPKPEPEQPAEPAQPESKPEPPAAAPDPVETAPAPEPEATPVAQPTPAPAPVAVTDEDLERERWLAKAQSPPEDVRQLRVAGVLDEMSAACFGPDCDLLRIEAENWAEAMDAHEPHLLLVESAWQGNNGSWQYMVASYTHPDYIGLPNLRSLIAWCRERDIPTVFWNKEDPVHFERFKEAAALFDYIFTSDSNCIERYAALEREGAGPISSLQFAAQPRVHNPIGAPVERSTSPVFAGAYYRDRHIDRQRSLQMLLDAAMPFGLEIYDRRFGHEDKAFGFPERFTERVKGALPYDQMINAYKGHRIFLNVNSVHDSPTMFSRRVFELLACGTAVVSTESVGVEQTLGDVVSMVETPEQATEALSKLQDDEYWRELTQEGRRRVVGEHTYRHRLAEVANTLGFNVAAYPGEEIAALALVDDVEQARRFRAVVSSVSAQETRPAELLIGSHTSVAGDLQELQSDGGEIRVRVVQQDPEATRSQRYRELAALAASPWLAIVHPAHTYGEHHLTDLVLSTRYVDADVIGNASFETTEGTGAIDRSLEHRFVDSVHPHSVLVKRELIATRGWPDDAGGASLSDWFREGVRIYSGDAGNFSADAAVGLPGRAAGIGP